MLRRFVLCCVLLMSAVSAPTTGAAQGLGAGQSGGITRLEIIRVESPTFEGRAFGSRRAV